MRTLLSTATIFVILAATANGATTTTTTFTGGDTQGWSGTGSPTNTFVDLNDGNPLPSLRTSWPDFAIFGITFTNNTNPGFLGDYTHAPFTISLDHKTRLLGALNPTVRDCVVELRDYTNPPAGYQYVSVYYDLDDFRDPLAGGTGAWQNASVTVTNPTQATLPAGWGGTGAEDPVTFEPILPPDRTFASVLASVDEIVFTTFKPGFFYVDEYFDVAVDNISVNFIPEPGALSLLAGASLLVLRRR
jgi:hypothetical protein